MKTTAQGAALRQARQQLLSHGDCASGLIDARLSRSWQRSLAAGLRPTGGLGAPDNLEQAALAQLRSRHPALLAHSRPVMEYLFAQVRQSQSVVVLAAPCGTLVDSCGDPYFLDKAARVALTSGASWHETQRGTNAIGTALAELAPTEIHGAEHFLERNGFLTCAAAPILSGTGELLGILDISGEHGRGQAHTLGLVSTAACMIENRLLTAPGQRHLRLHLHAQPEGIASVGEGIVLLSEDGWVLGANRSALALLQIRPTQLGGVALEDLLDLRFVDLLAAHHRHPDRPQALRLRHGAVLFGQLFADARTLPASPRSTPAARPAAVPADALAQQDTGDARWSAAAARVRRVLGKPIAVLVQGESGVGKEWFARAAHDSGPRRSGPFVAVNCAALPESLIEAELFGYSAGAFTGARREGRPGLLREAHGGTLFLDEIGDMPLALQTRLLRVLQEREVTPLGGGRAVAVDFALICASHRVLRDEVEAGRFRADLYYRINGLTVELPALRERSDFDALTQRMLQSFEPGRALQISPSLLAALARHHWPGNLRQCASVLRTACALLDEGDDTLDWHHLCDDFAAELRRGTRLATTPPLARAPQNLQELSQSALQQALQSCRGNIAQAARTLGVSRQTVYRKLAAQRRTPAA